MPKEVWTAARPCVTWGFPLRILSTHNGQNCRFYKFIEQVNKEKLSWSLHTTPIQLAVAEGLADKIYGRITTEEEKEAWIQEQREDCFDEYTWRQEYCCEAIDEASAFLTYELIHSCEFDGLFKDLAEISGDLFVGMDIGRKKDLTVIWVLELLGNVKYTRMIKEIEKTPFHIQQEILSNILKHKKLRRCCIDATGLGMQLAETTQRQFGKYRVEPITFTNKVKEELAYGLRTNFEDKTIYIPGQHDIREDLHSVRRITSSAGNIRFDVDKSEASGHADRFWALALALHSAASNVGAINISTRKKRESYNLTQNYL